MSQRWYITDNIQKHMQRLHEIARMAAENVPWTNTDDSGMHAVRTSSTPTAVTQAYIEAMRELLKEFPPPENESMRYM